MSITTELLSGIVGVEIKGLDTRGPLPIEAEEIITQAFSKHHLVLIRNASLSEEEQIRLSTLVGHVSARRMKEGRQIMYISNVHDDGVLPDGEIYFHTDHSHFEHPLKAIALYAQIIPSTGGDTLFSNAAAAYALLPDALKQRISTLKALHIKDYTVNRGDVRSKGTKKGPDAPHWVHPVVWTHPDSGVPVLFVNRLLTARIVGMPEGEGDALLEELFAYIADPRVVYCHQWHKGDYVLWDNRVLQHARTHFDPREQRVLRRVPIEADEGGQQDARM
jgi:alpha-ketoglutarate-dependent taurine dioxygenase